MSSKNLYDHKYKCNTTIWFIIQSFCDAGHLLLGGVFKEIPKKLLTTISEDDLVITTSDISEYDITVSDISENDNRGGHMSKQNALTEPVYYILLSLLTPMHGYGIMQNVKKLTNGRVNIGAGTLYCIGCYPCCREYSCFRRANDRRRNLSGGQNNRYSVFCFCGCVYRYGRIRNSFSG